MTSHATNAKTFRLRIQRQNEPSPRGTPYWELFDVPYRPNMNIISALQWIAANPRTVEGRNTTPVVWDSNCLEEVCGACTMVINGRARQSCSALVDEMAKQAGEGKPITLQPMTKFPVVRDLWVDRQRMFEALKRIKGWVPIDGTHALGAGPTEQPDKQAVRYKMSECMTCGCCLEACPQYLLGNSFVGAATINQVRYFNAHSTGAVLKDDRLEVMAEAGGINDCGNAQNCVRVCPKDIPLTESIADIGRQTTVHALKQFFSGR